MATTRLRGKSGRATSSHTTGGGAARGPRRPSRRSSRIIFPTAVSVATLGFDPPASLDGILGLYRGPSWSASGYDKPLSIGPTGHPKAGDVLSRDMRRDAYFSARGGAQSIFLAVAHIPRRAVRGERTHRLPLPYPLPRNSTGFQLLPFDQDNNLLISRLLTDPSRQLTMG